MSLERLDHIVAGVLLDFGGYLTLRNKPFTTSAKNSAPMVKAIKAFMKLRGVDNTCEPFFQWPARCSLDGDTNTPSRIEAALEILKSEMRDDPKYAWGWHCDIAMSMLYEGILPDEASAATARFMQSCFGVDTTKPPTPEVLPITKEAEMSKEQQVVVVAIYKTVNSSEAKVFKTEEQALQWRTDIAMLYWNDEFPDYPKPEEGAIGYTYFDLMGSMTERAEDFQTYFTTIEG
jgi:hypothetical protein